MTTFKGSQNNEFAQVATPGGASGDPQPSVFSSAPLCDEFGRLIVVIDGVVSTSGGGGGGGNADALDTTGAPVNVNLAAPPTPGQVLQATDATHATWQTIIISSGLQYIGGSSSPPVGKWCSLNSATLTLPASAVAGDSIGVFVPKEHDGAGATPQPDTQLWFGNHIYDTSPLILRGGTYYEWTLELIGESLSWLPRGMSNENPAPLVHAAAGTPLPNEWAKANNYGAAVPMPANPQGGDSFAVLANSDGDVNVIPDTGDGVQSHDLAQFATGPAFITIKTGSYYEWFWNDDDGYWQPRTNVFMLAPAAVATAITTGTLPIDMAGKAIHNLANPAAAQDAATQAYVLANATPLTSVAPTQVSVVAAAVGTGTSAARSDHLHSVSTAAPSALAVGSTQSTGTSTSLARADHVHAMPGVAASGASGFMSGSDQTKVSLVGSNWRAPVRVIALSNVPQQSAGGAATIDGVIVLNGDRVLLTNQTTASANGIYVVSTASAWSRAADATTFVSGTIVCASEGSTLTKTAFVLANLDPITVGTTNLSFVPSFGLRSSNVPNAIVPTATASQGVTYQWAPIDHTHNFPAPNPSLNDFRLNTFNTSAPPADGTAYSSVFMARFKGQRIALYFGADWYNVTCPTGSDPVLAVSGQSTGIPFDVFAVQNGINAAPNMFSLTWTNATTRATALVLQDGVLVRSGTPSWRYLGTVLANGATTYAHVAAGSGANSAICGIWNQDNRIRGQFTWSAAFDSWTIPSANTWQQINAQASAKVQLVQGQTFDIVKASHIGAAAAGASEAALGIGLDSTSAPSGLRDLATANGPITPLQAQFQQLMTSPGSHALNALAIATATSAIFYGSHNNMQGGISADLWF